MNKSLLSNYFFNLFYQILILITPLITTPYISRVLGPEGIGVYSYTLSICTYFMYVASLGLPMHGQREVAYTQDNINDRSKLFFEIFLFRLLASLIILSIYIIFIFCFSEKYFYILLLQGIGIISAIFDISWFFAGLEEFKKIAIRNTFIKIISILAIFIFVNDKDDLYIYILCITLSNLVGNLSLCFYFPKYISKVKIRDMEIFKHLKLALSLLLPSLMIQIYTIVDKTLLGRIGHSIAEVGFYEQSQKIINLSIALITSLGTVLMPRLAFSFSINDKKSIENYLKIAMNITFLLTLPIVMGLIGVSGNLVPWFFGPGFEKVNVLLKIFSPLVLIMGISNILGTQYLIATKKESKLTRYIIYGTLINITLDIILIPRFNSIGTAIATLIAEFSLLIIIINNIRKEVELSINYRVVSNYLYSSIIMFLFIVIIQEYFELNASYMNTLILIIIGIVIYVLVLLLLKDKYITDFIFKIKNKMKLS